MKSHSDYVKDFDRAWDDPATIVEKCWENNPHKKHLWRRVRTNDYPDVDETMRKCEGVRTPEEQLLHVIFSNEYEIKEGVKNDDLHS